MLTAVYLAAVNLLAFIVFAADKRRALHNEWRIPEKTLLLLALAGGSAGAYLSMRLFRHKTRKPVFAAGIPVMIAVQAALLLAAAVKQRGLP